MNLIKFPKITSDAFVIDTAIILDASTLVECTSTGATCVATFSGNNSDSILTFTFDGTTANRLVSATAMQTLLTNTCATLAGPAGNSKGVFDFVPEAKTTAGKVAFESRFGGIVDATATSGTVIVSIART